MAFRRDRWAELGGFDDLYHPFYWEDVDLGYRAWARDWRVLYEPAAVVYHAQGETIARLHRAAHVEMISARERDPVHLEEPARSGRVPARVAGGRRGRRRMTY